MADSNDIKITLTGEDNLSPVVQKAADNVQSSTDKMGESSDKMASDFKDNTDQINADFDQLERNITESCKNAEMSFESMNRKYRTIGNSMVLVGAGILASLTGITMSAMKNEEAISKMSAEDQANFKELQGSWDAMKKSALELTMAIGSALAPVFEGLIIILNAIIIPIKNFVSEHRTLVTVLAAVLIPLAGIVLALGTFMVIAVKVAAFIQAWRVLNITLTISQWALNAAMYANPIVWIIAAIVALIAVVVLVIKHFDTLKRWFSEGWDAIVGAIKKNFEFIKNIFIGTWHAIQTVFATIINGIMVGFEGFVNFFIKGINFIIGALNKLQVTIPSWVPGIGGDTWGINIPEVPEVRLPRVNIPALAGGGDILSSGSVLVGERGPELLNLPQGAQVAPLGAGTTILNIYLPDGLLIGTFEEVTTKLAPFMLQAFEYSRQGIVRGAR